MSAIACPARPRPLYARAAVGPLIIIACVALDACARLLGDEDHLGVTLAATARCLRRL